MVVSKKRSVKREEINVYLNYKELERVECMKYLGVYVDNSFKFDKHIKYICERCLKFISILSRSAKISWGLKQEAILTIYKGAILPILMYAAPVWHDELKKEKNKRLLQRVQRLINIKILKSFRTISYEASCILSGITPILIKIEEKVELYNRLREESLARREHLDNEERRSVENSVMWFNIRNRKKELSAELEENSKIKWQEEWSKSGKGALTKQFFPTVIIRSKVQLPPNPKLIVMLSGHGKLKSYLAKYKIIEDATCVCNEDEQTVQFCRDNEQILYHLYRRKIVFGH